MASPPRVLHEIDVALIAHELIKIRVFSNARDERAALLERICTELSAAPVQHLGKVLIIWRRAPEIETGRAASAAEAQDRGPCRHAAGRASAIAPDEPRTRRQWVPSGTTGAPRGGHRSHEMLTRRRGGADPPTWLVVRLPASDAR
jgi:RNA-binding protein YhbY